MACGKERAAKGGRGRAGGEGMPKRAPEKERRKTERHKKARRNEKGRLPFWQSALLVRGTRLELAWYNHTPLKRARLPIPPSSHGCAATGCRVKYFIIHSHKKSISFCAFSAEKVPKKSRLHDRTGLCMQAGSNLFRQSRDRRQSLHARRPPANTLPLP